MLLSASPHGCFDSSDLEQLVSMRGLISITQGRYQLRQHSKEVDDLPVRLSVHKLERGLFGLWSFSDDWCLPEKATQKFYDSPVSGRIGGL